ncbi:glutaredoxin-related protein [Litoreibacter meonggei]|uniref:Glutaredoxin-related protein n=1 Tax=Litoreibacter meonggei TaxID=1049199 RepID=A0A497X2N0_9RHOB|nr:glutaredoxin domain-containing protein [Litoreibacter meonggei]RLJ59993.1 glutaredoxin-related protein [Litoreibacter meonggei]
MSDEIEEYLDDIFSEHRVVLFMNGAVQSPADAESMMALDLLTALQIEFYPVDVSRDPRLLVAVQERSEWQQLAQLFIDGQFIVDTYNMSPTLKSKQLDKILNTKSVAFSKAAADQFREMNK